MAVAATAVCAFALGITSCAAGGADDADRHHPDRHRADARGAARSGTSRRVDAERPFTIVVLPDTQYYTRHATPTRNVFLGQTRWIRNHRTALNIPIVLHEGDVVDDECSAAQWRIASVAMHELDGLIPYAIAPGNHDVLPAGHTCGVIASASTREDSSHFDAPGHFPPSRMRATQPTHWVGTSAPGHAGTSARTVDIGGTQLLILTLPFGPSAHDVAWAGSIAARFAKRTAILVTHDYLAADGSLRGSRPGQKYLPIGPGELTGRQIHDRLVVRHPNIRLVLNGHVEQCETTPNEAPCQRHGVAGRTSERRAGGSLVVSLLADYQVMPGGGAGYLRLLRVHPDAHTIDVRTYSPSRHRYLNDPRNRFTLHGIAM
jgi:hypothetical protein